MRYSKALAISFCILTLISGAAAFYGTGSIDMKKVPPPSESVCNDGKDNDGDGYTDGPQDPGCAKPFNLDRAEEDVRDSDATYALADGEPNVGDASPAFPGWYKNAQLAGWDGWNDAVSTSGGDATASEQFAKNPDGFWAGGDRFTHDVTFSDSTKKSYSIGSFVVSVPAPSDVTDRVCGNGDRNSGEDNFNCPEDWGLPDDLGRTEGISALSISHALTTFHSISAPSTGHTDDPVQYIMDLEGLEHDGTEYEGITGICSDGGCSSTEVTYEHDGITEDPDFYNVPGNRDRIKQVYLKPEKTQFGSVTDYNPTSSEYDHFTSTSGSVDYNCDSSGTTNLSCYDTGTDKCRENNDRTITKKEVEGVWTDLSGSPQSSPSVDTKKRYTSKSGTYDYTREASSRGLTVDVYYDKRVDGPEIDAYECTNWADEMDCRETGDGHSGSCDFDTDYSIYSNSPKDIQDGYESATETYYYEKLVWKEKKIFDTNPAESPRNSKNAMFGGDPALAGTQHPKYSEIYYNNHGGRAYWSVDANMTYGGFSNHPAVSSSVFKVELSGDSFLSKRDWYGLYDADGSYGGGDSYIPLKEGSVAGDAVNSIFGNETKIVSSDGTTVGTMEGQEANYIGPNAYGGTSCPGSYGFCVEAVDLNNEPLSAWSNPSNPPQPGSGVTFEQEGLAHVNESWSVCRLYQKQIGGADNSYLRCQFDHARNYPSGPTPSYRAALKPFYPSNR